MSIATLNGSTVITGSLTLPDRGLWEARLELDADTLPSGKATLSIARDDGGPPALFVGVIGVESSVWAGRARVNVIPGAGALATLALGARSYGSPVALPSVLADVLDDAGESSAPNALAGVMLPRWSRAAGTGARALSLLGYTWRALPDGTIWMGAETWPAGDVKGWLQQSDDGEARVLDVAPTHAGVLPGMTAFGKQVSCVVYSVSEKGMRAELFYT